MRFNWNFLRLVVAASLIVLGAGCGGISATHSVSPASFFLPGLGQVTPDQTEPITPIHLAETAPPMAQSR